MELLKDILIKEARGNDKVLIVDNLPKELLYRKALKMIIDYTDPQQRQNLVPAFTISQHGHKINTGEMVDELLPGIERSNTGDEAYVFFVDLNEAKERLAAIDRYIQMVVPQADRVPVRISYAAQPGLSSSAPLARHQIPRVVLPELVSPPAVPAAQVPATRALEPVKDQNRKVMTEEMKEAARQRMANARAAKEAKKVN